MLRGAGYMYKMILYDTSNYVDFPIGGQLTSVRNFLRYMALKHSEECSGILLVGVTNTETEVGKKRQVCISGVEFDFLPVLWREPDLNNVKKSLRVQFLKALFKNGKKIPCDKKTIHYFHTPEAFIYTKLIHPFATTAVFSHGSFFNMVAGFRFFQNNKIIEVCFNCFIKILLKKATIVFALDNDSKAAYEACGANVKMVENSIILPDEQLVRKNIHDPLRVLFVGRLSKVKRVDIIIKAMKKYEGKYVLTIVGDGEENQKLHFLTKELDIEDNIKFAGKVRPGEVKEFMADNDILIMNSVLEGKPMTIIEALSYGMPIITTPVGGIPDLVKEYENAIFTNGTEEDIVVALKKITERYEVFSYGAISTSRKYDYRVVNERIYEALSEISQ